MPGLGLTERAWAPTVARLPPRTWSVVRLPGHGLRTTRRRDVSPPALARVLLRRLDALGHDRVVLVGHSASCQVVAEAAAVDPRVVGLVLVGPTTDPRDRGWPGLVRRWLATARNEPPRLLAPLTPQYARTGLVSMTRAMRQAKAHDIVPALATAAVPVVVLRGRDDHITPADWTSRLGRLPTARSATAPSGAHMIPMTDGPVVAEAIEELVSSLPG